MPRTKQVVNKKSTKSSIKAKTKPKSRSYKYNLSTKQYEELKGKLVKLGGDDGLLTYKQITRFLPNTPENANDLRKLARDLKKQNIDIINPNSRNNRTDDDEWEDKKRQELNH